jgi:hypothetical protein
MHIINERREVQSYILHGMYARGNALSIKKKRGMLNNHL